MPKNYLRSSNAQGHPGASIVKTPSAQPWWLGLALLLTLSLSFRVQAQQRPGAAFFAADADAQAAAASSPLRAALFQARALTLNVPAIAAALATAPPEGQSGASPLILSLPLPDGSTGRFAVFETAVMAPALAAQFPDIKTYTGVGLDDASATVRLDLTPQAFHAQILSPVSGTIYIDPITRNNRQHYLSFYRRDMNRAAAGPLPVCSSRPSAAAQVAQQQRLAARQGGSGPAQISTGTVLRSYRLALAATSEYTAFQGGTVALAQAAIVTSVNRVVGVYEKELAVRMVLIANNSSLVYTNSATDPYTNNDPNALLTQNQNNVDAVIGAANYDIGHVFSTAGGGLAEVGVVCRNGDKAQGETGTSSPVGDSFDIDYVAHEMGHQFGGNHPFNSVTSNCGGGNRTATTAWEPGSGSTIMAYAGICGADNLQQDSDAYFNTGNFEEMEDFIASTTCATTSTTSNSAPVVTPPASGLTLPISTPFQLTASATDAENDALTYCWEEHDLGNAAALTTPQATNDNVPLFRSLLPVSSPTRYFPKLTDIIANTSSTSERLPTVTRILTFRCTARDQHNSGGSVGVVGGVNYSGFVTLPVTAAAGPFLITAPNTALTWAGNSTQTVTWNVAGTTANNVNCANVSILLSTDGGLTYPTTIVASTPNDGSQAITVPNTASTTARIMVAAVGNYFFDISNTDFTITASSCNAPTSLTAGSITANSASVSFTPNSSASSYTVTTSPATTTQTINGSPASFTGLSPSTAYTVNIVSNCSGGATSPAATTSFTTTAAPCNAPTSLSANSVTSNSASVSFMASSSATNYTVTTSPATTTQTITGSPASFTGLAASTAYTVSIVSNCTGGAVSSAATTMFTTTAPPCNAPTNLVAGSVTANTASVSFTASGSATSYTVTTTPATTTQTITSSPATFSGLSASTAYSVSIVSNCVGGATSSAATTSFTTTTAPCNAPTNLTASSITQSSASISFTASSSATNYTVTTTPATTTQTITSSPASLSGLADGTSYMVTIVSNCAGGATSTAATVSFTTTVAPCNAPTSLAVSSITPASASISFTASSSATSYTVTTLPVTTTQNITTTSASLTGLTPGTAYTVSVVSNCTGNTTSSAATANFTTTGTPCTAPTSLTAGSITATSASVSFTASGSAASYTVTTTPLTTTQTITGSPASFTGLTPSTAYMVSIVSNCSGGATSTATTTSFTTAGPPCNAPSSLAVSSITQTSASISFATSASATSYTVTTSPATSTQTITTSSASLTGLTAGTAYTVTIVSNCAGGAVSSAATANFTTTAPPCNAPTSLAVGSITTSSASLSFAGSGSATSYTVTTNPATTTLTPTASPVSLTGLTAGTAYSVSIVSNCSGGTTSSAATTSFTTTAAPSCTAPTGLLASNVTATSAQVSFTASGTATSYTVTTVPATTAQTINFSPASFAGLSPNTGYTVNIVSNCTGGATSGLASTSFTTTGLPDLVVNTATSITPGAYHNITVTSLGAGYLTGTTTATGTVTVQTGGSLADSCQVLTGTGNFTLEAGATIKICNPLGISNSGATGSIQVTGTRSYSTGASYVYTGSVAQITGTGLPPTVLNLTSTNTGTLNLTQAVAVSEVLKLAAGNLQLGAFNLTLLSNATGTAMVVNSGSGRVVNNGAGIAIMQRFITPTTPYTGPGYRHYAAPVSNTTVADLAVSGLFTPLVNSAYNALPTPALPLAQFPNIFDYDQNRLSSTYPGFDYGWQSPTSTSENLAVTKGYTVNIVPAATVDLRGQLNTGSISTGALGRAPVADGGYQLLGNPYPAPLNWALTTTAPHSLPNGLADAIYVF